MGGSRSTLGNTTQSESDTITCCRGSARRNERGWMETERSDDTKASIFYPYLGQVEERGGTLERVRQHPGAGEQQTAGVGHGAQRGVAGRFAHLAGRSFRSTLSLSSGSCSLSLTVTLSSDHLPFKFLSLFFFSSPLAFVSLLKMRHGGERRADNVHVPPLSLLLLLLSPCLSFSLSLLPRLCLLCVR